MTDIFVHYQAFAEKIGISFVRNALLLEYVQRVYVNASLETVSSTISQYFACTNVAEEVEVDGVAYRMFVRGTHDWETSIEATGCTEETDVSNQCAECGCSYKETLYPSGHDWSEDYTCRVCGDAPEYITECGLELETLILVDGVFYTVDGNPVVIAVTAPLDIYFEGLSLADYVNKYGANSFSMRYWNDLLDATNEDGFAPLTQETLVWILDLITGNPVWGENSMQLWHYLGIHVLRDQVCNHQYQSVVTAPTCTGQGYTTHTCTNCGDSYVDNYTDALGHSYDTVTVEPTCTEAGAVTHTCANCGDTYTEQIPATGHSFVDGTCEHCGAPEAIPGDVNGDGRVNARDARAVLRFIADMTEEGEINEDVADFNGDGRINARDARAILRHIAGLD